MGTCLVLRRLRAGGCPVFFEKLKTNKLESKFDKGYYFCFPSDQRVLISRDVVFLEKEFLQEESIRKKVNLKEMSSEFFDLCPVRKPIHSQSVQVVPLHMRLIDVVCISPSKRIYFVVEEIQEVFMYGDSDQDVDPTIYGVTMLDIKMALGYAI